MHTAIDKFLNLRREINRAQGHEKPYKPLVLLVAIDMLEAGAARPYCIPWNKEVCERFSHLFNIVKLAGDNDNVTDPFPRLHTDAIWKVTEKATGYHHKGRLTKKQFDLVEAIPEPDVAELFANSTLRREVRNILVSRYFPTFANKLHYQETDIPELCVAEDSEVYQLRDISFRKEITNLYDNQCAVCGLRIILPQTERSVSFVDAAHIKPFAEEPNDHPSNGMALCKNHHWAMDRHVIAPGVDLKWHVSPVLDRRRSKGEAELSELEGKDILLPKESTYHPANPALQWRMNHLLGA